MSNQGKIVFFSGFFPNIVLNYIMMNLQYN